MATKSTRRTAARKQAPPPPPPPVEEEVENDDERQTLLLEDEKYFVDELSEDAQDIVKLLQHLNPQAEEAKKQYLVLEKARAGLIEDLRVEVLGEEQKRGESPFFIGRIRSKLQQLHPQRLLEHLEILKNQEQRP